MTDGTVVKGDIELTAPNDVGVVLKVDGKLQTRTAWNKFSQESLQEFQKDIKYKKFVDVLITAAPAGGEKGAAKSPKAGKKAEAIKEVEHPARITPRPGIIGGFFTPLGFVIFLAFWGSSLYAGYEIARFRNHPLPMACGVSAVVPVIGPIVFLCLKPKEEELTGHGYTEGSDGGVMSTGAPSAGAASEVEPEPAADAVPQTIVYKRGEFTFNRRFIETKFAGFFRLVPGEAEKNLRLMFITARGEFTGRRISKVSQTDLQLVVQKDEVFTDVAIPLNDITEIQVRHKDA